MKKFYFVRISETKQKIGFLLAYDVLVSLAAIFWDRSQASNWKFLAQNTIKRKGKRRFVTKIISMYIIRISLPFFGGSPG